MFHVGDDADALTRATLRVLSHVERVLLHDVNHEAHQFLFRRRLHNAANVDRPLGADPNLRNDRTGG